MKSIGTRMNRRTLTLLLALALVILTLLTFGPVRFHGFLIWDDVAYVVENPHVRSGLSVENVVWAFTTRYASYWHPFTWLSHMLDVELYGLNPEGHHWNNLLLHVAGTLLLFLLLKSMTGALWRSALAAALFSLHPLRIESVAWVAERKDLLGLFFWMVTLWMYHQYAIERTSRKYLLALFFFILGLLSKPTLVALPVVLLLLDFWPLRRFGSARDSGGRQASRDSFRILILEKIPFFLLAGASGLVTYLAARDIGALPGTDAVPFSIRFGNVLISYVRYLLKTIWPGGLSFYYPFPQDPWPLWQVVGCFLILGTLTLLAVRSASRHPYFMVGWFWFLATLLPVIGIIQVGSQSMADRFTYVPHVGLFVAAVWWSADLTADWPSRKLVQCLISFIVLFPLALTTHHQLRFWKDDFSLFSRSVQVTRNNYFAHYMLGETFLRQAKTDEAILEYEKAIRILPENPLFHRAMGIAFLKQRKFGDAVKQFRKVVTISPGSPAALTDLGAALKEQGELEEAVRFLHQALSLKPLPETHHNLGLIYAGRGDFQNAIHHYEQALRIRPDSIMVHNDLGVALYSIGEIERALSHVSEALRMDPGNPRVRQNLLIIQDRMRNSTEDPLDKR